MKDSFSVAVVSVLAICFILPSLALLQPVSRFFTLPDGGLRGVQRNFRSVYTLVPIENFGNNFVDRKQRSQLYPTVTAPIANEKSPTDSLSNVNRSNQRKYYLNTYFPHLVNDNGKTLMSYRRYRTALPTIVSSAESDISNIATNGGDNELQRNLPEEELQYINQPRILNWLFGRPSYSPYARPDYSILESAAGVNRYPYGSYGSRYPPGMMYPPGGPSYVVEECTELLDPITHEIIEDCYEVPVAY